MLAELMANGDEEEREATRQGDISPLFLGHMGHRIHAVVAVATALNGNSVFDMLADPSFDLKSVKVPWWSRYFGKRMSDSLQTNHDGWDLKDCADYDMQIDQALLLNQRMHTPFLSCIIFPYHVVFRRRAVTGISLKREWSRSLLCVHIKLASIQV